MVVYDIYFIIGILNGCSIQSTNTRNKNYIKLPSGPHISAVIKTTRYIIATG
jgi:hypothetical protein